MYAYSQCLGNSSRTTVIFHNENILEKGVIQTHLTTLDTSLIVCVCMRACVCTKPSSSMDIPTFYTDTMMVHDKHSYLR